MKNRIITGLTMGEPAGISSEITLKVWKKHRNPINPFVYIGDTNHLLKTNLLLKYNVPIKRIKNIFDSFKLFKISVGIFLLTEINFSSFLTAVIAKG